ncbi:hypothetical protein Esi_0422_0006 [Ectocarpus siliculosus]|uniref:Uncharacterized protein n=1 Tax=Ectocarpus siliculosus TaxID=2880 RepID=D8LN07_ECTSI|nr:hypothetical protein Esi_0422_0006 [Ectocarpus siliculosus]|eukprot:CBN76248.1 hypothetical protein Esi_0422_0006 [Ectocarpus siliculosus]
MEDKQLSVRFSGSVDSGPRSSSSDDDGESEWEAFDAAFRGKTASMTDPAATATPGRVTLARRPFKENQRAASGRARTHRTDSAASSSAEDLRVLAPTRAGLHGSNSSPAGQLAPGYDGDNDHVGTSQRPYRHHHVAGSATSHLHENDFNNKYRTHHHQTGAVLQPARRLPLYHHNDATQATPNSSSPSALNDTSRAFVWSVLLHGCLCEAPLAVLEGLARGPLYLVAAAWVALVASVGASGHAHHHRAGLRKHAAALAREGLLLLAASLTLAVPFATSFTVYGEVVVDRALDEEEASWDVRPVPTVLGAVDPLRFCVFAFGQAGELAANGRPEPLQQPFSELTGGGYGLRTTGPGGYAEGFRPANYDDGDGGGRSNKPPSILYVGAIAAQSMDADRMGVGILHPPEELGLRLRQAAAQGKRAVVSAYRRLAYSATATYHRRLPTLSSTAVTRLGNMSSG